MPQRPRPRHLFSSIVLYYDFQTKATFPVIQDLWHTLERHPHLAAGVTAFEVYVQNIRWNILTAGYGESTDEIGLPGIMAALTRAQAPRDGRRGRLRTLALGGYDRHTHATSWSQFHPAFQHGWAELARASAVTTLKVRTVRGYPVRCVLEDMPALRRLEMGLATFDNFPARLPRVRSGAMPCPQLVELRTDDSILESEGYEAQDAVPKSREVPQRLFSALEVVECYLLRSWPHVYVDVVAMSALTIRSLKITSPKYTDTTLAIFPSLDLGAMPCIRTLVIELRHDVPYCWHRMPAVLDFLEHSTTNSITSLRIDILTDGLVSQNVDDKPELLVEPEPETFQRLDNILSASAFDALRTLYVRLLWPAATTEVPMDDPTNLPSNIDALDLCTRLPLTRQKMERRNNQASSKI
ncbi:hypothetical protein BJ912DRAFT_974317 [Pholiota molesta]|nr:hypothetical protein BJ912DRAFT_974317 [Pholiota molesta]